MSSSRPGKTSDKDFKNFDTIINAVVERGNDEKPEEVDDYAALIRTIEYQRLVVYQLYDSYFPPRRHEYELQLLTTLVEHVATNTTAVFISGAIAGGVLGNASYDGLKLSLRHLLAKLKPIKRSHRCFQEISDNTDHLIQFFEKRTQADLPTICRALNAEADKIEPLLMLLGFRSQRRGKRRVWIAPKPLTNPKRKKFVK